MPNTTTDAASDQNKTICKELPDCRKSNCPAKKIAAKKLMTGRNERKRQKTSPIHEIFQC
jgi:hypothetical protein